MPATGHPISLAHLTVLDATPPELVTVAAAAGFRTVGIRLTATPSVGVPPYDVLHEGPMLRETMLRLKDTGVSVLDTEFLRFEPEHPIGIPEGFLEFRWRWWKPGAGSMSPILILLGRGLLHQPLQHLVGLRPDDAAAAGHERRHAGDSVSS